MEKLSKKDSEYILGLAEGYSQEDVRAAYKRLSKICHPDVNGTAGLFSLVNESYKVLRGASQSTTQTPPKNKPPKPKQRQAREYSFQEAMADPDFYVPFRQLKQLLTLGVPVFVTYKGGAVWITKNDIAGKFVPSAIEVRIRLTSWRSWFHRLLGALPIADTEKLFEVRNHAPNINDFSMSFSISSLSRGYNRIRISVIGTTDPPTELFFRTRKRKPTLSLETRKWLVALPGFSLFLKFNIKGKNIG